MNKLWMVLCKVSTCCTRFGKFHPRCHAQSRVQQAIAVKQVFDVPVLQVVGESGGADKIFPKGDISERIDEQIVHDVPVSQSLEVGRHTKLLHGAEEDQRRFNKDKQAGRRTPNP